MALPKVITIIGTRPQFIKSAVLSRHLVGIVEEDILHTGQHYDHLMSDALFSQLGIPKPKWRLNCQENTHGAMTAKMLEGIEVILQEQKPQAVLLYGDTNSTLAGALAASKLHIPIWHVESGVRSFNKRMPEEINRIITDRISDVCFAPSQTACDNLIKEGVDRSAIYNVGDVMLDLYLSSLDKAKQVSLPFDDDFLLLTLHRAENFSDINHIKNLFKNINSISEHFRIVFPIHPRVQKIITAKNIQLSSRVFQCAPFDYYEMIYALGKCQGVLTDSGGLQKEAFYAFKPCVIIRQETEWVELLNSGWNILCPSNDLSANLKSIINFLSEDFKNKKRDFFYGAGDACKKIVDVIRKIT